MATLLVVCQLPEGALDDADKGALNEAGKLARLRGDGLVAARFPAPEDAAADQPAEAETLEAFGAYGVSEVRELAAGRDLADYPDARAEALVQAAREVDAEVVLLAHNDQGSALAPGLAVGLGAALVTEAVTFERTEQGLRFTRPALGDRAHESLLWDEHRPLVVTVDPKRTSATVLPSMRPSRPTLQRVSVTPSAGAFRQRVVERVPPDPQTVDVSEAEVILCAGKGFDRDSFIQFQELARLLRASLGVTRPVYDLGFAGFERMIGQTGKTVAPRFYLGMGISGSMHHVGGIRDSKHLVSLNIDPKVPIFPNSDEGFVGDIREVLPLLLDQVKARLSEGGAA
jgi:electron transfer flavoprotein alpha subunit